METNKINLWVFKTVADEDRAYQSISGYDDDLARNYNYDNAVANSKQVKEGDLVIIVDKTYILGFAKINTIVPTAGKKKRLKCPECGTTNYTTRKNIKPIYKCNHGHEFEVLAEETVDITRYSADYGSTFIKPNKNIPVAELRPYFDNNYNRNMSIQHLDMLFFTKHFKNIPDLLSNSLGACLLPYDAIIETPDERVDAYIPSENDERALIYRQIRERRGQKSFRDSIIKRYGVQCMITGCPLLDILEAAHIKPYRGINDNSPSNGLLLRSDIHTLFDLDLIGIDPETLIIHIAERAKDAGYREFSGKKIKNISETLKPNLEALKIRWVIFIGK